MNNAKNLQCKCTRESVIMNKFELIRMREMQPRIKFDFVKLRTLEEKGVCFHSHACISTHRRIVCVVCGQRSQV